MVKCHRFETTWGWVNDRISILSSCKLGPTPGHLWGEGGVKQLRGSKRNVSGGDAKTRAKNEHARDNPQRSQTYIRSRTTARGFLPQRSVHLCGWGRQNKLVVLVRSESPESIQKVSLCVCVSVHTVRFYPGRHDRLQAEGNGLTWGWVTGSEVKGEAA